MVNVDVIAVAIAAMQVNRIPMSEILRNRLSKKDIDQLMNQINSLSYDETNK